MRARSSPEAGSAKRASSMTEPLAGVILAGGLSRGMGGGDKCLRPLGGRPILSRIIERARPQVSHLVLNANGDPLRSRSSGLPVIGVSAAGFPGPLAGILAGLEWAAAHAPECRYIVSFAGDAPFLPADLAARFLAAVAETAADLACAVSAGQTHPVFGLWRGGLRPTLRAAFEAEAKPKRDPWAAPPTLVARAVSATPARPLFHSHPPGPPLPP